jgi:hypothetical protein
MLPWLNLVIWARGLDLSHLLHLSCFIYFDVVKINEFSFIVLDQLLHSSAAVASTLCIWMSSNSDDSSATKLSKCLILELLRHCPGNEITGWSQTSLELIHH